MHGEPFTAIGRIAKTHGLKGEVSVISYGEASLDVLVGTDVWFVPAPSAHRTSRIVSVRPGPKGPIATLADVSSIDDARALVGCEVLAQTEAIPDDWFEEAPADAVGLIVTDAERGLLGEVSEVIITGANDVWVVDGPFGEVLIPVIDDVVLEVDDEAGTATVRLLEGLLPGEGEEA